MIYLDHNATTPPCPEAIAAAELAMRDAWANPSSVHRAGQAARRLTETARRQVATLIGASARDIVFAGDGSEAIDMAVRGSLRGVATPNVVTSVTEHAAVRESLEALGDRAEVRHAPVSSDGQVDVGALLGLIDANTALVSVHWANNETGAVQPIERLASECEQRRVRFHTDATQWVGKRPTDVSSHPGISLLTCSPHKFGGLKGVGVLYVRRGCGWGTPRPGSQELGRRGGTENVPGIAGAGAAAAVAGQRLDADPAWAGVGELRDRLERGVLERCAGAVVLASGRDRLANTASIAFPTLEAEAVLLLLSERGVCASAGAACSSGSLEPSPVLLAMGIEPSIAHGTVRFSLGPDTTPAEIDEAIGIIAGAVDTLSGSSSALGG